MLGSNRARCTEKYTNFRAQGSIWQHFEARWGLLGTPLTSLGTILASTWGPQALFLTVLSEPCDLCISMPLSRGIAIIADPCIQVGATCDQKSHLNGSRTAEAAQPSSDFEGTAEPSPAEPISKPSRPSPAGPAQQSRAPPFPPLDLSGEPTI